MHQIPRKVHFFISDAFPLQRKSISNRKNNEKVMCVFFLHKQFYQEETSIIESAVTGKKNNTYFVCYRKSIMTNKCLPIPCNEIFPAAEISMPVRI